MLLPWSRSVRCVRTGPSVGLGARVALRSWRLTAVVCSCGTRGLCMLTAERGPADSEGRTRSASLGTLQPVRIAAQFTHDGWACPSTRSIPAGRPVHTARGDLYPATRTCSGDARSNHECRYPAVMNTVVELAAVRLRTPHGRWPAGSHGVVVNYRPDWPVATVDFSDLVPVAERDGIDFSELVPEVAVVDLESVDFAESGHGQ